jgi:hypothetical protein
VDDKFQQQRTEAFTHDAEQRFANLDLLGSLPSHESGKQLSEALAIARAFEKKRPPFG